MFRNIFNENDVVSKLASKYNYGLGMQGIRSYDLGSHFCNINKKRNKQYL